MNQPGQFPREVTENNSENSNWPTYLQPLNQPGQFPREVTENNSENSNWPTYWEQLNQPGDNFLQPIHIPGQQSTYYPAKTSGDNVEQYPETFIIELNGSYEIQRTGKTMVLVPKDKDIHFGVILPEIGDSESISEYKEVFGNADRCQKICHFLCRDLHERQTEMEVSDALHVHKSLKLLSEGERLQKALAEGFKELEFASYCLLQILEDLQCRSTYLMQYEKEPLHYSTTGQIVKHSSHGFRQEMLLTFLEQCAAGLN